MHTKSVLLFLIRLNCQQMFIWLPCLEYRPDFEYMPGAGLLTSIANTNTYMKKYCWYQYQYCCRKVLAIPIPILFSQYFSHCIL